MGRTPLLAREAEDWSRVLQPGENLPPEATYLPATCDNVLWGRLPCAADDPVLTVTPGTDVIFDTLSHEGLLEDQGRDPVAFFGRHGVTADDVLRDAVEVAARVRHDPVADGPHVVTGPVWVSGACPGDVLAVTVVRAERRAPYGVVSSRHGRGALPGELPRGGQTVSVFCEVGCAPDGRIVGRMPLVDGGDPVVELELAPFPGIVGVATAGTERAHSVPPGPHGGNLDVKLLTAGATLLLPVQVPGALAYVGDPHFAQGDGEVALTALEASLRVTVRFDVIPAEQASWVDGPLIVTPEYLVPLGLDVDLDEALRRCVRRAVALLGHRYGMAEHLAYAYLSAATDFDVSQVVDQVAGVHARIRRADFGDGGR